MARLGDIITQVRGVSYKPEDVCNDASENSIGLLRANNIKDGHIILDDIVYVNTKCVSNAQRLRAGDILVCTSSGSKDLVGKAAYVDSDLSMAFGAFCKVVRPNNAYPKYIGHFFNSPQYRKKISDAAAGANINNIRNEHIDCLEIPLPPLDEQRRIAAVLDKAATLIDLRKQQLAKLDELVKARFAEMFGDTFSNPKEWPTKTFREASIRLSDGPFGSNLKSEHYSDKGIRVIRLGNIGVGEFIDDDKSYISTEHYERLKKYTCKSGEIVIGTLGEPNLRACIVPEFVGIAVNKADCVHYIPNPDILDSIFVCQYINCPTTLLLASGMIHGQTRSRVSSGQIAEMPIYIPPIELQLEFARFIKRINKSKAAIQKALDEAQLLFDSLMQKYFG